MVLTAAQTTAFFELPAQMAIAHDMRSQLQQEGIDNVVDLADFEKDTLKQVADNLRRPGGRIQTPVRRQELRSRHHRLYSELNPKCVYSQHVIWSATMAR
jgi:hypothetical protein